MVFILSLFFRDVFEVVCVVVTGCKNRAVGALRVCTGTWVPEELGKVRVGDLG